MKTAISIKNEVFLNAERVARRLGISRSELYTRAVAEYVRAHLRDHVTDALNAVYAEESSDLDGLLASIQWASLGREDW